MTESPKLLPRRATSSLETELPAHISQNIADIVELQRQHANALSAAQKRLERMGRRLAQPRYLIGLSAAIATWIALNLAAPHWGWAPLDVPPFPWLEGALTFIALVTTIIVLIGQRRQTQLSEQRAHLDLQINLLTEQKVTKIIHLLEELRQDLPIQDRHDPQAAALKQATDAAQLLSALQRSDLGPESPPTGPKPDHRVGEP